MGRIEIGLFMPNGPQAWQQRTADLDRTLALISGHFTSAWLADHLQFKDHDLLEGWTALTYFAARHPTLRFGHTVLSQSFRNPALLAKMAATLQFLSGGRLILGLGAGWYELEYRAYNFPFPAPGQRLAELEETVQIIKALWQGEEATVTGRYYAIQGAVCNPCPDPLPPLMIGGSRPRMLRLIARHADWWDVSGLGVSLDNYRRAAAEMALACVEVGRDPATLRRTYTVACACAPTEAAARALATDIRPGLGLIGTPSQIVAQFQPFIELGVDHFQLDFAGFPDSAPLELFIAEVLPALNGG